MTTELQKLVVDLRAGKTILDRLSLAPSTWSVARHVCKRVATEIERAVQADSGDVARTVDEPPAVGQRWRDRDPRSGHRVGEILDIANGYARMKWSTGRTNNVSVRRLSRDYELVSVPWCSRHERANCPCCEDCGALNTPHMPGCPRGPGDSKSKEPSQ